MCCQIEPLSWAVEGILQGMPNLLMNNGTRWDPIQRWDFLEQERSRGQTTFKPLQIAKEFNDATRLTRLALL